MDLQILDIIKAITLGVVEGVTEFLPISSTGHLILVNEFLSFDRDFTTLFDIVIQLGAILAVIIYFFRDLWPLHSDKTIKKSSLSVWSKTIIGVLPTLALGAIFASFIKEKLFNPYVVATSLLVGGLIIIFVENRNIRSRVNDIKDLSYKDAFKIGLIQCLAMIPGVSRSASTIMGGMLLGASRSVAAEFSFFLAIPTMLAATSYSLLKYEGGFDINNISLLLTGFVTSFLVALFVVKFLMGYIKKHDFKMFGYYRIALAIIVFLYFYFK